MNLDNMNILHHQFWSLQDKQVKAHKVVLSSSSKLFRRILIKNPHQHPLIYLKGIPYETLQSVLQFLYIGQIDIPTEQAPLFFKTARELEVNGLDELIQSDNGDDLREGEILEPKEEENEDKQNDIKSLKKYKNKQIVRESIGTLFNKLIEDQSQQKLVSYQCTKCANSFTSKTDLKKHTRTVHEGLNYPFTNAERVRRWKERKRALISEETFQMMRKVEHQRRNAELRAKRLSDKDFDEQLKKNSRERKRRLREKKYLEEALAQKLDANDSDLLADVVECTV